MEEDSIKRKGRGGRRPKPAAEKLTVRHNLKVSADDEVALQADFKQHMQGRPLAFEAYLRERLLGSKKEKAGSGSAGKLNKSGLNSLLVTLVDLKRILNGISINYNQSMRVINNLSDTAQLKHDLVQ